MLATLAVAAPVPAAPPLELTDSLESALSRGRVESLDELRSLEAQVRRVVEAARPATVAVELNDSIGSGVVISADGIVLTAGHVTVEPNRELWLRFPDNTRVRGRSFGVNHNVDSGLLKIEEDPPGETGWPFAPIAQDEPSPGEWVVGLGQPNGYFDDRAPPVRLGRLLHARDDTLNTDTTLVGGDSGGPLLNLRGEVVGIHSRIGERITDNYHVSIAAYHSEWDRLLAGRMSGAPDGEDPGDFRPLVGLAVRVVDGRCVVTQVFAGGAAEQAGVRVGDIVESLAGEPVGDVAALARLAAVQETFDRAPLRLMRDGESLEVELWIGRAAKPFPGVEAPPGRLRGLSFWGAPR